MEKIERVMSIDFESKPFYGDDDDDDDKYMKTKIKKYNDNIMTNFHKKSTQWKNTMQMFINNNTRFCYWSIWKVLPSNIFRRM